MLYNYFKIALRNIAHSKVYSAINILGLALGIACCLLLTLYIQDEASYDQHHARIDDIYRIVTVKTDDTGEVKWGAVSPPIAMTVKDEVPEVEAAVRVLNPPGVAQSLIRYQENLFYESDGWLADSTLFDVLTYDLIEGNSKKALVEANSVVISKKLSEKIFGDEPALNKVISISQGGELSDYKVTGVFVENYKSHIKANFFTSMTSKGWGEYVTKNNETANEWAGQNFIPSYLKLVPGNDKTLVEKKINDVLQRHGAEAMKALGLHKTLSLEPVKSIYLESETDKSPRITYLYVVGSLAIFILLIACINFMNLSTAKATKRAAEIGIRKTMGAFRSSLIGQLMGEAMIIVIFSILISIVIVQLALPFFNQLTDKTISFNSTNTPYFIAMLVVIALFTGLVAGSYPAFYLSSFQPAQVLKGKIKLGNSAGRLRQALVVFQFMIAIVLVCGIFLISRQLNYVIEKDLGFDSHSKIVVPIRTEEAHNQYAALRRQLESNSNIDAVSGCDYIPGSRIFSDMMFYSDGGSMDNAVDILRNRVDAGYVELLNIKLLAGRTFTDNRTMDSQSKLILNRTSAEKFGFTPEKIVGQNLHFDWQGQKYDFEVIGVIEDYHQSSLHEAIQPTLFEMADSTNRYDYIIVSVATENFEQTTQFVEQTWKSLIHDTPFEYSFLDDNIQKQYSSDRKISRIVTSFGLIAMAICGLGLYGLSSYMAERRFKEIGIRKVMGASVSQIVSMMSTEFIKLVLIAFVIAVPVAWYCMTKWLEGFSYKTPIEWSIFVLAGLIALTIAMITISFESIKSAISNPVDSLRSE
jgi:putative ABC transport system permease protein